MCKKLAATDRHKNWPIDLQKVTQLISYWSNSV